MEEKRKRGRPRKIVPMVQTTTLDEYVKESVEFIREHEPEEGYFVGFSGGKDSIVALELVRMAGVKYKAFFSCTRIDPPEVYKFIRKHYLEVTWLYPKITFWEGIKTKMPPLRMQRWCCDVLKKDPAKDIPLKHRIMGIRAEESVRRASRPRISMFMKQTTYKPIFTWPEWAVWQFIEDNVLPYPSLYDEGFGRLGCIMCPYIMGGNPGAVAQRTQSMERWPEMWRVFEKTVKYWYNHLDGGSRYAYMYIDADDYYQDYLNGFEYQR